MQPESAVFELLVQPTQTGIVALKNASLYVLSYGRTAACVGMGLKSLLVIMLLGELLEAVEEGGGEGSGFATGVWELHKSSGGIEQGSCPPKQIHTEVTNDSHNRNELKKKQEHMTKDIWYTVCGFSR